METEAFMNWAEVSHVYVLAAVFIHDGVSGGKGGHSFNEQQQADKLRQQELDLSKQQLGLQQQQIGGINAVLDPLIAQGGMSKDQQAALTSQLMNNIPQQFRGIQGQITNQLAARGISGGQFAGSGDIARQFGGLGAMEAGLQQSGLENIQNQKAQQLFQALGTKAGIAGLYGQNTSLFNQGAIGTLGASVGAANNADQAQTSWMGPVFGGLGAIGGGAFGKGGIFGKP